MIPVEARQDIGMQELLNSIFEVASGRYICKPYRIKSKSKEINNAVEILIDKIKIEFPDLPNAKWVAVRLMEGDQSIINAIRNGELGSIKEIKANDLLEMENV